MARYKLSKEVAKECTAAKPVKMSGISGVNVKDDPKGRACGFCEARKGRRLINCLERAILKANGMEYDMTKNMDVKALLETIENSMKIARAYDHISDNSYSNLPWPRFKQHVIVKDVYAPNKVPAAK